MARLATVGRTRILQVLADGGHISEMEIYSLIRLRDGDDNVVGAVRSDTLWNLLREGLIIKKAGGAWTYMNTYHIKPKGGGITNERTRSTSHPADTL